MITNPKDGTSLFYTERSFGDPGKKDAKFNSCYETAVKIIIDDLVFEMRGPVTNGANPVQDNSMTQSRVYAAQKRLFVKGVAIRTGLGFNLWLKEEQEVLTLASAVFSLKLLILLLQLCYGLYYSGFRGAIKRKLKYII